MTLNITLLNVSETFKMQEAKLAISLGSFCTTSYLLKEFGYKQVSYPFDWIFSSLSMVEHCLVDNFTEFLQRLYYDKGNEKDNTYHWFYQSFVFPKNPKHSTIFAHRNLLNDIDYAYYERCVERFRNIISNDQVCKVFIVTYVWNIDTRKDQDILSFHSFLTSQVTNFILVIIDCQKLNSAETITREEIRPSLIQYQLHVTSKNNGKYFEDMTDNLNYQRILQENLN